MRAVVALVVALLVAGCSTRLEDLPTPVYYWRDSSLCGDIIAVDATGERFDAANVCEGGVFRLYSVGRLSPAEFAELRAAFEALPPPDPLLRQVTCPYAVAIRKSPRATDAWHYCDGRGAIELRGVEDPEARNEQIAAVANLVRGTH